MTLFLPASFFVRFRFSPLYFFNVLNLSNFKLNLQLFLQYKISQIRFINDFLNKINNSQNGYVDSRDDDTSEVCVMNVHIYRCVYVLCVPYVGMRVS